MDGEAEDLTRLLDLAAQGDAAASEEVVARVCHELRRSAAWNVSRMPRGETLQPTALVNEAWLRLARPERAGWEGHKTFFFTAAWRDRD